MFIDILSFELRLRLRKISTYIYFGLFFLIGYAAIYRGSFGSGPLRFFTSAGIGNINANAPYVLFILITMMSYFGLLITCAFFGNAAYRDFKENTYGLYFSYPVKKIDYFAGRFTGAAISTLFVFSGAGLGAFLGSLPPFVNPEKIGQINLFAYIQPYLIGVLPNILLAGAIFFSLALITRKFFPVYVGIIAILISYRVGVSLAQGQSKLMASLIDPLGYIAARYFYGYWTAAQKNILLIPLSGNFLLNRIIWIALGIVILIIAYKKFHFSHIIESKKQRLSNLKPIIKGSLNISGKNIINIKATRVFHFKNNIQQMLYTSFHEFRGLIKNIYFLLILFLGTLFIFIMGFRNVGLIRGTQTYPVTSQVLDTTQTTLYLFCLVIVFFCSGELVWRERNKKVQEIYDALPLPEWVPFIGKLGALWLVQVMIMLTIMFSGIIIQILHGYYFFELGLYIKELFGIRLVYYLLISVFAMFIQVIVNKKFLGYVVTLLLIDDFIPSLGLEHHLWRFASTPIYTYSDMNGYGPYVKPLLFFNLYWCFAAVLLIVLSTLFWVRGNDTNLKSRINTIKTRMTRTKLITISTALFLCILIGSFIIYNTNILNRFESRKAIEKMKVDYEKKYKKYENTPQPRITDIKMNVDIYPYQRKVSSSGRIMLENKTEFEITDVFIQVPGNGKLNKLGLDVAYSVKEQAKDHGVYLYKLNKPMKSGEKMELNFNIEVSEKGFKNHDSNGIFRSTYTRLVHNGTFLYPFDIAPAIGYDPYYLYELGDNDKRKKYGLKTKERIASIYDDKARMNTLVSMDADWINFEAVVSTSSDQTALTSGELLKEWVEGGRHYFFYKTRRKILRYFSFISAKYWVRKDKWQDTTIEVYYQKGHDYNINLIIKAIKESLEYFTTNFSPYQFKQVKVVEFPRYALYAEAFPNIILHSEGLGFIAKFDNTKVEYLFRVTAHEVGHQWWAHQVIGAGVQGAFLMSEVMAQYSALMVIKNEYDQKKINDYIKQKIDYYLRGRARETQEEVPIVLTNLEVPYVHYEKGIVVMNALQDYIGEDNLNAALRKYINKVAFQEPPYTTSLEFIKYLRKATPDHLKYIIRDMFETITLYENKSLKATYKELVKGKYLVNFKFEANKLRADEIGNEKAIKINDYITFGVFGADGEELYLKKHFVNSEEDELEFIVDKVPKRAGIDPYYYLIDKNTNDNIIDIEKK